MMGVFDKDALKRHWRVRTSRDATSDEYGIALLGLFSAAGIDPGSVKGAVISSVVPPLDKTVKEALGAYLSVKAGIAGEDVRIPMPVSTDNPAEVGTDRLVNAVAAYAQYRTALIVVDFGTAVTFDYVTPGGEYAGGAIAPGVAIAAEALFSRTAKLPRVEIQKPGRVIGKNTIECMRSGIFYGFTGLVDGIIERMKKEAGGDIPVVATGGLASIVVGESRYVTGADEFLTLKGLKILYREGTRL